MAKKKRRPSAPPAPSIPRRMLEELAEAERLMSRGRAREALARLQSLDQLYPNRVEVLMELLNACYDLSDMPQYQAVAERLARLRPNDSEVALGLAGAYLANVRPALALRAFHRFLDRWPNHERADEARETVEQLESTLRPELESYGFPSDEGFELAAMHEEGQALLQQGRYAQARRVEQELLRRQPDFAPALNNISLTYRIEGDLDAAIATSRKVLTFDPDNYHALANLVQYLCVSGRLDEAREWAERLRPVVSTNPDIWTKKAEAFSYLGDDPSVLEAFTAAQQNEHAMMPHDEALLYHLAAVAAMRLGREEEARRHWQRALKLSPGMDLVENNLADLRLPVGQRNAPWAFGFPQWVTQKAIRELAIQVERAARLRQENEVKRATRRYLEQHPEMAALIPVLLDRGDPEARGFGLRLAMMAETPEAMAALKEFALSQRGPDVMRSEAAQAATQAGLLPPGPRRLWVQGEWREIMAIGFEIYSEPESTHSPEVEEWVREATLALYAEEADRAEQLLQKALAVEPDAPDVLNNLAAAYEMQGRRKEAYELGRQISERFPDYLFGRISAALLALRDGKTEEAEALLMPLLERPRLHTSEFAELCRGLVELYLAKGSRDAARSWLDLWASVDKDNPDIERLRRRVGEPGERRGLFGRRGPT